MSTNFGFSIPQDQVKEGYQNLPNGKYAFKLVDAERKASKNDARNWYVEAKFEVIAGNLAGKTHIERYNVGHASEETKGIALSQLKQLSAAVGYTGPLAGMDPYLQKPFCGTVFTKIKPANDEAGTPERVNVNITKYEPIAAYQANPEPAAANVVVGSFAPPVPTVTQTPSAAPWAGQAQAA